MCGRGKTQNKTKVVWPHETNISETTFTCDGIYVLANTYFPSDATNPAVLPTRMVPDIVILFRKKQSYPSSE